MKTLKNFLIITLPTLLVIFILIEMVFRFIIVGGILPYRRTNTVDNNVLFRYDKRVLAKGTYSLGKFATHVSQWSLNNDEWNSDIDYIKAKSKKRVIVIGDSFVAGVEVNQKDHFGSKLRQLFNDSIDVYTIGVGGAPLADYYKFTEYALKYYKPDLIILNVVGNDFDESIKSMVARPYNWQVDLTDSVPKFVTPEVYVPSKFRRFLSNSYFVRWLSSNLQADFSLPFAPKKPQAGQSGGFDSTALATMQRASDFILKETIALDKNCQFVVSSNLPYLSDTENGGNPLNKILTNSCQVLKIPKVDIAKVYFADYTQNKKPWVFLEYNDSHWNEKGHEEVARILSATIKDNLKL